MSYGAMWTRPIKHQLLDRSLLTPSYSCPSSLDIAEDGAGLVSTTARTSQLSVRLMERSNIWSS